MGLLENANRNTGDWLPKVENCKNRVKPCGNPFCADEAMRARNIRAGSSNSYQAEHAYKHAHKIADQCKPDFCPLEAAAQTDIHTALDTLSN